MAHLKQKHETTGYRQMLWICDFRLERKKKRLVPQTKQNKTRRKERKKKDVPDECNKKKKKKHLEHLNRSSNHVWMCVSVYECVGFKDQV